LSQLLTIASGNPSKVAEIEAMLGPLPLVVQRQPDDLDVEETGDTYGDNANLKAPPRPYEPKGGPSPTIPA
jgi:inosine/xanthosine triphosphate pyrophosphatase family protein